MDEVTKGLSIFTRIGLIVLIIIITSSFNKQVDEPITNEPLLFQPDYTTMLLSGYISSTKEENKKRERLKTVVAPRKVTEEKQQPKVDDDSNWSDYKLTHYVATCKGCSGITKSGVDVRNIVEYEGYKILSVDTRKIPLGSIVEIKDGDDTFKAIARDTGGAIKGNKLDLLVKTVREARNLGVKQIRLKVVRNGWGD
jgi:3D (Asp-Asp-Asp) domain-containing protein